jgi:hypothetical protein
MNRNQKIALGCGGAGCLGLIVVAIAAGVLYFLVWRTPARRSYNNNYNVSTNRNSNSNDNSDFNSNTNNSNSSRSTSDDSGLSEDDKHKLYQAAGMTGDAELIRRVSIKIGLMDEDYTPGENYQSFIEEHASWAIRNTDFIQSINTAEKARAYLQTHLPD